MYRNLETVDDAAFERVKRAYERVAELVGTFPVMRPGMVAVIADSPAQVERANEIVKVLGQLGLPTVRHVASPATTPGFVLQLVQQLEASFARLVFVAVGENDLLRAMLDAASSAPVLDGDGRAATAGDAVRQALRARRHGALRPYAADAGQRALERAARRCVAAAAGADAAMEPRLVNGLSGAPNVALRDDELQRIAQRLGREPTIVELHAFDAQWSEHCSYKSSRHHLSAFRRAARASCSGPARTPASCTRRARRRTYCVVVAHESHNHPSQVVPFEGAATGIGGIVRDVLCMGAEVIAVADPLRFGRVERPATLAARHVAQGVVDGIGAYGNAIGVPNVAGDVYFDEGFDDNCLVNVVALGIVKETEIIHSYAPKGADGWEIVLVGKATDPSGFGGASFSSLTLDAKDAEPNKGAVQVPDPFLEKRVDARELSRLCAAARAQDCRRFQGPRRRRNHGLLGGDHRARRLRRADRSRRGQRCRRRHAAGSDRGRRDAGAPALGRAAGRSRRGAANLQRGVHAARDRVQRARRRDRATSRRSGATSCAIAARS